MGLGVSGKPEGLPMLSFDWRPSVWPRKSGGRNYIGTTIRGDVGIILRGYIGTTIRMI